MLKPRRPTSRIALLGSKVKLERFHRREEAGIPAMGDVDARGAHMLCRGAHQEYLDALHADPLIFRKDTGKHTRPWDQTVFCALGREQQRWNRDLACRYEVHDITTRVLVRQGLKHMLHERPGAGEVLGQASILQEVGCALFSTRAFQLVCSRKAGTKQLDPW